MISNHDDAGMPPSLWRQLAAWAGKVGFTNKLAVAIMLGALVARRIVAVWIQRRKGMTGSRLCVHPVGLFSLLAILPIVSAVYLYVGIQSWFSEQVSTAVRESLAVAEAYLHEHQEVLQADAVATANDINREGTRLLDDPQRFAQVVATQTALRELTEAIVFDGAGRVLARAGQDVAREFVTVPDPDLRRAREDGFVLMMNEAGDRVRILIPLDRSGDTYLIVGRAIDPTILTHIKKHVPTAGPYDRVLRAPE